MTQLLTNENYPYPVMDIMEGVVSCGIMGSSQHQIYSEEGPRLAINVKRL